MDEVLKLLANVEATLVAEVSKGVENYQYQLGYIRGVRESINIIKQKKEQSRYEEN